jgi:hypothetical protein
MVSFLLPPFLPRMKDPKKKKRKKKKEEVKVTRSFIKIVI